MTDSTFPGATPIPCPLLQEFDGHGGICITDAEGRQLGYISSHPNQTLRAARVVDAVQDYDALKAEVQRLREAGEAVAREWQEYLEDEDRTHPQGAVYVAIGNLMSALK